VRSLLLFLGKYNSVFLFLILETICIILIVKHNWYQRSLYVQKGTEITGKVYVAYNWVTEFFTLRDENQRLANENARLRQQLEGEEIVNPIIHAQDQKFDIEGLTYTVVDTIRKKYKINDTLPDRDTMYIIERRPKYEFIAAKVVNSTIHMKNNYITINKGSSHGIINGMSVISNEGVVGLIYNVSENFSTIISILHEDFRISAINKFNGVNCNIVWDGEDYKYAIIKELPKSYLNFMQVGDSLVTKGSDRWANNIPIGVVAKSFAGNDFAEVTVMLSTHFESLRYVYVIKNKMQLEQQELEKKNKQSE